MAEHGSKLSAQNLRMLLQNSTRSVAIFYRETTTSSSHQLKPAFLTSVLLIFSDKALHDDRASVKATGKHMSALSIAGGSFDACMAILNWMLECCSGEGLVSFRMLATYPRFDAVVKTSEILCINSLSKRLQERKSSAVLGKPHSDDIQIIYAETPSNQPARLRAADTIATMLFKREEFARGPTHHLRSKLPDFDCDINILFDEKVQAAIHARQAAAA